jgi:hypothetical protein
MAGIVTQIPIFARLFWSNPVASVQFRFWEGTALILTFSPWEKEQRSADSGDAAACPAKTGQGLSNRRRKILLRPLGEGRGEGVRNDTIQQKQICTRQVAFWIKIVIGLEKKNHD